MKVISRYPSIKAGRAMPCEASHEELLVYISEADSNVMDYLTQPHRLEMYPSDGSRRRVYFPDMWRLMADGSVEIVETKKSMSEIERRPEIRQKLEWAEEAYARLGYRFKVMTAEDDLDVRPLLANAKMIALDNKTAWGTADLLRLQSAFARADFGTIKYAAAIDAIATDGRDPIDAGAILHAMIVRRKVGIDIFKRISGDTPVSLIEEQA